MPWARSLRASMCSAAGLPGMGREQVAVVRVSSQVSGGFAVGQPELNRIITTVEEILVTGQAGQPIVESEQKFEVQPEDAAEVIARGNAILRTLTA